MAMVGPQEEPLGADGGDCLVRKLKHLGLDRDEELQAFMLLNRCRRTISRGEDITRFDRSQRLLTVLTAGVACRYKMTEDGRRQIFMFQYPGDFCDSNRHVLSDLSDAVAALTDCSVAVILHEDVERIAARYPRLSLALWRDTLLEGSIIRERLLNVSQRPALTRIAHLICEQMARLEAIGLSNTFIPLTQVDLANAAGLSVVHTNRTIQDLRELRILSKNRRAIEVVDRERLVDTAKFDGRYLKPQVMSHWTHLPWINHSVRDLIHFAKSVD